MLDKGEYPRAITEVLSQIQGKDKDAAAKLEDKVVKKLQSSNMLTTPDAGSLAVSLLQRGPRPAASSDTTTSANDKPIVGGPVLAQSAYLDLMGTVIDTAMKATPATGSMNNNQRGPNNFRGRGGVGGGPGARATQGNNAALTDVQMEQLSARRLLSDVRNLLPQIDQYLPDRAQSVRQKITEVGLGNDQRQPMVQIANAMQQGTSESLIAAANSAPAQLQPRIYQQAALRALDEGNIDLARQIANEHLDAGLRDAILQNVEFRATSEKADAGKISDVRQTLAKLRTDSERVNLLVQLSDSVRTSNPKLSLQLLDEARQYTTKRATSYQQFDSQIRLAEAYKSVDISRSFEVLEPGILQLNELLSAAAVLSGFEVNIFRDGELPLDVGSQLSGQVSRFGRTLGNLADVDFERAQSLANRFQLVEPRIVARMAIVRGLLGVRQGAGEGGFVFRGPGQNFTIVPQP
jgi:hypothetical protein